jgi:hypothetical protein
MDGAGGTNGGINRFVLGLIMLVAGTYLLLNSIHVNFNLGSRMYGYQGYSVTSGMIMIPFMIGVGMLFFNARNIIAWIVTFGSLAILIIGVISSTQFTLRSMTAFELILILVLMVGGLGLFLSSFRSLSS